MKKIVFILGVIFLTISSFTTTHKFYVSVTQIDYNEEQKSLQIISRIFVDDFEATLQDRYDSSIKLSSENPNDKIDGYIEKYLQQKISISVNGKPVVFEYIGKEYDNDLILCYLEVEGVQDLETIEVSNTVLMDAFNEQQNIVHVKKGTQRKSLMLENEISQGMLKFSE
ncbi:hypothetical protein GCM10022393_04410 [Aquimarina addita]|uniref:Peptidase E n=1 Tax=Aquimarina addita TaxID=870485 RepID=A0ABP7XA83_9FLAO